MLLIHGDRAVVGAVAEWLAKEWELDLKNTEDQTLFRYGAIQLENALQSDSIPAVALQLEHIYNRLRAYRGLRGRVPADETLDNWLAALRIVLARLAVERIRGA